MTWLATWPENGQPAYEEAPHQTAAEQRAKAIVDSGKAKVATAFEIDQLEEIA